MIERTATVFFGISAAVLFLQLKAVLGGRKHSAGEKSALAASFVLAAVSELLACLSIWTVSVEGKTGSVADLELHRYSNPTSQTFWLQAGALLASYTASFVLGGILVFRCSSLNIFSHSKVYSNSFTAITMICLFISWSSSVVGCLSNWNSADWQMFGASASVWPFALLLLYAFIGIGSCLSANEVENSYMKVYTLQQEFVTLNASLTRAAISLGSINLVFCLIAARGFILEPNNQTAAAVGSLVGAFGIILSPLLFKITLNFIHSPTVDKLTDATALALASPAAKEMLLAPKHNSRHESV
ncbi:hypothetical protein BDR26DRAFT_854324 [Obelidium mucronatum]|nr:hypothetical protein BDR26DRAFT_854324 [Obelidium mucronatum]